MSLSYRVFVFLIIGFILGGCGSDNDSSSTTGQFIDDPVQGLNYACSSGTVGVTNEDGEYTCDVGDDVTFSIGTVTIGKIAAQAEIITPYSFFPNDIDAALNLAILLQSLDTDPNDGIIVLDAALVALLPENTDFSVSTFEADIESALNITLVSATDAQNQLNDSILEAGGNIPDGGHIPIADAGDDQNVLTLSTVTLDGTNSTDADGDTLTYLWSVISTPTDSTATLTDATLVKPTFTADKDGSYVVQLIVDDGTVSSAADTVTITATTANAAPVAAAGDDQNVSTLSTVTLDGSASSDADSGDTLTYLWSITSTPADSTATLSDATLPNPTFTADKDGSYLVQLIVNDGTVDSVPDTVTITATTANAKPVANAGPDQNVNTADLVFLPGDGSSDADGDELTYSWSLISKPQESTTTLLDPTYWRPKFVPEIDGSYVIQLIVNDGTVDSDPDTVTITATTANAAPVANAGPDQNIATTDTATLDGSASSDADSGDTLTYLWSITSTPADSTATLSDVTLVNPTFTADKTGSYVVQLIVNDGTDNSAPDTVTVTASTTITHNGITYSPVVSPYTEKIWLDRNLGATQVCTSSSDADCYGDYYQWGRDTDGHELTSASTTPTQATGIDNVGSLFIADADAVDWVSSGVDTNGALRAAKWSKTDGTSVCPVGYRVPTITELQIETTANGVTSEETAFSNFLKLPAVGYRYYATGEVINPTLIGTIWSSTPIATAEAYYLDTRGNSPPGWRSNGASVRCIKD